MDHEEGGEEVGFEAGAGFGEGGVEEGHGVVAACIVDEDVEFAAGERGDGGEGGEDAFVGGYIKGEGCHAEGAKVVEDGDVAGCCYDMTACDSAISVCS